VIAIRTILHPTDFSERSAAAFRLACSLARDHGATLIVLHVASPDVYLADGMYIPLPPGHRLDLKRRLEALRPEGGDVRIEYRLVEGGPAPEILRVAAEEPCDLVVMGTHGRTGLGRLLMGSVAELVVRKAPCPVLTVKEPFAPADEPVAAAEEVSHR
jgi:nucleotide-binding universal stress UspA family protein